MEWAFAAFIIIMVCGISGKVDDLSKKIDNMEYSKFSQSKIRNNLLLDEYVGKRVTLEIDNDEIENWYLFDSTSDTEGEIVEYDDEWLLFRYYHKEKKKTIEQYLRLRDLVSINEVKND